MGYNKNIYVVLLKNGDAGYRSPCPSHAKRMLYHMSYTPLHIKSKEGNIKEKKVGI